MQGRYGVDDLSRFTMGVALVLIILAMFANIFSRTVGSTLDILGVAAIVYAYIRIFSRNIQQRYAENQKFLQMTSKFCFRFNKEKDMMISTAVRAADRRYVFQRERARSRSNVRNATQNS